MVPARIPGQTTNISDNWPTHIARGSLGGDDFTDSYGTPMYAQFDGYVSVLDSSSGGSGGRYIGITCSDGDRAECLHASSFIVSRGQSVSRGQVVGYSGASAYGSDWGTGGPHIHNHAVTPGGRRFSMVPYIFTGGNNPAGGGSNPIPEDDMYDAAAREEVVGRMDREIIPRLRNLDQKVNLYSTQIVEQVNQSLNTITTDIKNAIRRERYKLFRRSSNGGIIGVQFATGNVRQYNTWDELLWDVKMQIVSPVIDKNGVNPEPPKECTDDEFAAIYATARAIHDSPTGVSTGGKVVTVVNPYPVKK